MRDDTQDDIAASERLATGATRKLRVWNGITLLPVRAAREPVSLDHVNDLRNEEP